MKIFIDKYELQEIVMSHLEETFPNITIKTLEPKMGGQYEDLHFEGFMAEFNVKDIDFAKLPHQKETEL